MVLPSKETISGLIGFVVDSYNSGMSVNAIRRKYLLDHKTINKILKSNNILIENRPIKQFKEIEPYKWHDKDDRDRKVIEYYNKGYGAFVIGRALNIGKKTVYNILHNHNICTNDKDYKKKVDLNNVVKRYNDGESLIRIADFYNVDPQTLANRMKERGIGLRAPKETLMSIPMHLRDIVAEWYKSELSTYDISRRLRDDYDLDIHPNNVQKFIHSRGIMRNVIEVRRVVVERKYKNISYRTNVEKFVESILVRLGVEYDWQFGVDGWSFDFRVGNVLIECQGGYWHSLPQRRQRDDKKLKVVGGLGYRVCYVWEHEVGSEELIFNRIRNMVCDKPLFDFSKCVVSVVSHDECKKFLDRFHYQKSGRSGSLRVGFFLGEVLVGVCVFGYPVRQEVSERYGLEYQEVFELTRLCIDPVYQARNFASWMIARSRKMVRGNGKIKLLVSFADANYGHSGIIYKADNWEFDGCTVPSYWYVTKTRSIVHKKTVWEKAKKNNVHEGEQAIVDGLVKVRARPKNRYVYWLR